MNMKRIYFVRHGETEGNLGKFFQTSETPLTENGHTAAKKVSERFKKVSIDKLISPHVAQSRFVSYS